MAKAKQSKRPEKPERPQAPGSPASVPAVAQFKAGLVLWRDFIVVLLILLAFSATAFICFYEPLPTRTALLLTGVVWTLGLIAVFVRLQARKVSERLEAILTHREIVRAKLAPDITEEQSGIGMRQVSPWLVAVLGIAAASVLWSTDAVEQAVGGLSTLVVGGTVSVMLGLAVAANGINRAKTQRLTRDFRAALNSEKLALDTLGSLEVMISACLPSGERTRFNDNFLRFVGRTAAQMQGQGWLEVVHPEDRQGVLELVAKPLTATARRREHDICIRHRNGDWVWLHETLVARFDDKDQLIEFICTAIDITQRVEDQTKQEKLTGDLKADLAKAQTDLTVIKTELTEAKSELSKAKASRKRFESSAAELREESKTLREALSDAQATAQQALAKAGANLEDALAKGAERVKEANVEAKESLKAIEEAAESRVRKAEEAANGRVAKADEAVKSARQEHQQAVAENKKLTKAFENLQAEMGQLRLRDGDMRNQIARHLKETREADAEGSEAQKKAAQLQARTDQLTKRCEELGALLAAKEVAIRSAQDHAQQAGALAAAEVERRLHEVSAEALATQLRRQLDGMQRMSTELLAQALDGPVKDAAQNSAAAVRAMCDLVDQALKGSKPSAAGPAVPAASFDLKRSAQGVCELLAEDAKGKGVELHVEAAPNLPGLVYGDDIGIRTAMMSLFDATLSLVQDGTLTLRLSEDLNTGAHSTIRCEFIHTSARVKPEALETALALKSTDTQMPDAVKNPREHQAAKAWRAVRAMQGQHGFMLPEQGGLMIWFTFTLGRPAASATLRPENLMTAAPAAGMSQGMSPAQPESADPGPARPMPRMQTELLACSLGEVVELGVDSLRLFCAKPPKDTEVIFTFTDVDLDREFRAEVTWSKKLSRGRHDVGLKLLGLTQAEQQRVLRLAMQHRRLSAVPEAA